MQNMTTLNWKGFDYVQNIIATPVTSWTCKPGDSYGWIELSVEAPIISKLYVGMKCITSTPISSRTQNFMNSLAKAYSSCNDNKECMQKSMLTSGCAKYTMGTYFVCHDEKPPVPVTDDVLVEASSLLKEAKSGSISVSYRNVYKCDNTGKSWVLLTLKKNSQVLRDEWLGYKCTPQYAQTIQERVQNYAAAAQSCGLVANCMSKKMTTNFGCARYVEDYNGCIDFYKPKGTTRDIQTAIKSITAPVIRGNVAVSIKQAYACDSGCSWIELELKQNTLTKKAWICYPCK